ncbi:MAG: MMPL family transporter [Gemmatimonadales bacterium]|nr:MAG: MMPL family transporter [Gemmatimonadales bacterium]
MLLSTLARGLVRWRWLVIGVWLVVAVVALVRAPGTVEHLDLRGGSNLPTEARVADALLHSEFPRAFSEYLAVLVHGPSSFITGRPREALDSLLATTESLPYIRAVVSYPSTADTLFLSTDQRTTFFLAALGVPGKDAGDHVHRFRTALDETMSRQPARDAYTIEVTGRAPLELDIRTVSAEDSRRLEAWVLPITLVILVLAFGALVAAVLPLVVGVLAIAISLTVIGILAQVTPMSVFVLNLTSMVGLGVGIDYSLLMVTRFREELNRGLRSREAAERTLVTAVSAVVTSGLTVVVGFSALLFTPSVDTRSLGIGGLVVVAVSVLLCITLLPALLAAIGRSIDRPRWIARRLTWYHAPQIWERWARTLIRHPWRALLLGSIAIAILSIPLGRIRVGLPAHHWWPNQTEAGAGVETLTEMGRGGYLFPMRIVVELPEGERATRAVRLRGLRALGDSMRADPRVQDVRSIVDLSPGTSILGYSFLYSDLDSARVDFPALDAFLSPDARYTLLDVILSDTTSLTTSMEVVRHTRTVIASGAIRQLDDARVLVGGYVAAGVDFQDGLLAQFPQMVAIILTVTAIMLAIAFRSVLVPIKAVIMNSLSVMATFGIIVLVFQEGFAGRVFGITEPTEAIFVAVPVLVFAIVFGLSMDYEVFLLSRMKEAFDRTGKNTVATTEGLGATATVITSAALIMITAFGAFAFARVLVMQFLGFGLAVAVLLDATLIRMILVPAFMHLAGRWNWWPGGRRH